MPVVSSTGTMDLPWDSATALGNLVVAAICQWRGTPGIIISAPSGWTAITPISASVDAFVEFFYIENAASRSGTETFTSSVSHDMVGFLYEGSGFTTGALDVIASASGSSTVPSTGLTGTDASASELFLGILANRSNATTSAASWQGTATGGGAIDAVTIVNSATSANPAILSRLTAVLYERFPTGIGTGGIDANLSSSRPWVGIIVSFQVGAVTGTGGVAMPAAALAGTGVATPTSFTGTGNLGASAAGLASAGAEIFTGTGAVAMSPMSLAGSIGPTTGVGAITLQAASLAGTGTHTSGDSTGTAALAAVAASLAGTATVFAPAVFVGQGAVKMSLAAFSGIAANDLFITGTGAFGGGQAAFAGASPGVSGTSGIQIITSHTGKQEVSIKHNAKTDIQSLATASTVITP